VRPFSPPSRSGRLARIGAALVAALAVVAILGAPARAGDPPIVRVGVLKFGTVQWELDVIRRHQLDLKHGVHIEQVELAGKDATAVALQSKAVEAIVTDWLWVSHQRTAGEDYTFVAHSSAAGALMVRPDSGIKTLADLKGKRIGVAGGPVDKSWLLFRAYMRKTQDFDPASDAEPVFGAPPLLNELLLRGSLPAALNFWNYNARLAGTGITPLLTVADMLPPLGITTPLPLIGWVFSEHWAEANAEAVRGFLAASREAKELLAHSDEEWRNLLPLTQAKDDAALVALRDAYRQGIAESTGPEQLAAAETLLKRLAEIGEQDLVGPETRLAPGTFWAGGL
jgi:NitT/TauT family transport system substrate-binding protein